MTIHADRLAPPPRPAPLLLRLTNHVGGPIPQMGWIFFGMGLLAVTLLDVTDGLVHAAWFMTGTGEARGEVTHFESTGWQENDANVYRIWFRFEVEGGLPQRGAAYVTGTPIDPGTAVEVEYARRRPEIARIRGTRSAPTGLWASVFLLFPAIGIALVAAGLRTGARANHLLQYGVPARGTLTGTRPTNTRINNQTVYELTFAFEANGRTYEASARTHRPETLTDEAAERLLYDPAAPDGAVLLDGLPFSPVVGPDGSFTFPDTTARVRAVLALILPTLALTVNALVAVLT